MIFPVLLNAVLARSLSDLQRCHRASLG